VNQFVHSLYPRPHPPLFKTWARGGSGDASSKHIPFAFLFGNGTSDGCVRFVNSDSNDARALIVPMTDSVIGSKTVENCVKACGVAGYTIAGLELAQECCTCRIFDELSSPDNTSLLKGVTLFSEKTA
jgi:hypothetical protein